MTQSSDISVSRGATPGAVAPSPDAASRAEARGASERAAVDWRAVIAPLASLRLTVTLLALSIFLTFAGTLAQVDKGIWTVMGEYFRTAIAWIELGLFFPRAWNVPEWAGFWFPGGWLLGGLLLVNLLAAHAVRFRVKKDGARLVEGTIIIVGVGVLFAAMMADLHHEFEALRSYNVEMLIIMIASVAVYFACWFIFGKRAGISMLHAGLIFMLLSEIITGTFASEGVMTIREGETVNFIEHTRDWELAVVDTSDPAADRVTVIPGSRLAEVEGGEGVVSHPDLPFDVQVLDFMENSNLARIGPMVTNPATAGSGLEAVALERDPFIGAGDEASMVDMASAYLTLRPKGAAADQTLGTFLVSGFLSNQDIPQRIAVDGKTYDVYLRFHRTYTPFSLHLIDFQHKTFLGTSTPKDYRSIVHLKDPTTGDDRDYHIYMNHPLRHAGRTFFQSSFLQGDVGTVLQVVDNPGRLVPYISCFLVAVGLVGHFMLHLTGFLRRKAKATS